MTPEERAGKILHLWSGDRVSPANLNVRRSIADAIRAAVAEEREACAVLVESVSMPITATLAATIRARSNS